MSASSETLEIECIPEKSSMVLPVLAAVSFCHLLNDLVQSLIPAIYPILKDTHHLSFTQIGLITLTFQISASLLQPLVGVYADRRPMPYSLVFGMLFTLIGLVLLSVAQSYPALLIASALVGVGSAVFHPEASRVARMAAGRHHGFAQSFFQVGGNFGSAIGPLLGAFIVLQRGQGSIVWFSAVALLAMAILLQVGHWYARHTPARHELHAARAAAPRRANRTVLLAMGILIALMFSKFVYTVSLSNYYTFYLMERFHVSVQSSQLHLFAFLGAVALGTIFGGPIGDRFGRKFVIWYSILGTLPFTLALPHVGLFWTGVLTVCIGFILASAFPALLVYGQELMPGNVGLVAGLFFGLAFGMAGLAAAALGTLADYTSIEYVYRVCAFLPLIGLLTAFLPNVEEHPGPPVTKGREALNG